MLKPRPPYRFADAYFSYASTECLCFPSVGITWSHNFVLVFPARHDKALEIEDCFDKVDRRGHSPPLGVKLPSPFSTFGTLVTMSHTLIRQVIHFALL